MKHGSRLLMLTLIGCAVTGRPATADTAILPADRDTTLFSEDKNLSNGSGQWFFAGRTVSGNSRRALLHFDVAANIPAGATINSVTLTLQMSRSISGTEPVSLHRVLADWGEGASDAAGGEGGGTTAMEGDATWDYRFYVVANPPSSPAWASLGGDYTGTASATASIGGIGSYSWSSTSATVADVQAWLDTPATNYGWILIGNEGQTQTSKRFDSRTLVDAPELVINYTPSTIVGACCFGNGTCQLLSLSDCGTAGGAYQGQGTACSPNPCVVQTGACCFDDSTCADLSEADCATQGGTYQGDGVPCSTDLCPLLLTPYLDPLPIPAVATPSSGTVGGVATYDIDITEFTQQLHTELPPTTVWGYAGSFPGPTIETTTGNAVTINWINDLRDPNDNLRTEHYLPVDLCPHGAENVAKVVTHLHGGHAPAEYDGYPEDTFLPGFGDTYIFPNNQQAAQLWYHDHALGLTRMNVYMGLAGLYVVRDAAEQALNLPEGEFEVPLVIQDRSFHADGSLKYPAAWQEHFFGDKMLVNGMVWPYHDVKQGKYRLRVLNGCNSRTLTLAFDNAMTFEQIGSEGGLFEAPVTRSAVTLGPAERADLLVDFAPYAGGTEILLTNSAASPFPAGNPDNDLPQVMKFVVQAQAGDTDPVPPSLVTVEALDPNDAIEEREFILKKFTGGCTGTQWLINGLHWDHITEYPELDSTEIWSFANDSGISHPMHMHLVFFQVLDRQPFVIISDLVIPTGPRVPPEDNERGWKDTVMAHPGEIVRVIARFEDYAGKFAYHCHILEHEDHEMMRQFQTVLSGDLNGDCTVDLSDLATLLANFGDPGPGSPGDTDRDGDTDLTDLSVLLANFGRSCIP